MTPKSHIGIETIFLDECISTNDYAKSLIKSDKVKNGQVIQTDYQSGGRGRSGKYWESEPGSNLLMSIILIPENLPITNQFFLNLVFSLAILKTLIEVTHLKNFKVKWPNDVYFSDRKISGILIENFLSPKKIDEAVIGIGLNVNQHFFKTENATSLFQITRIHYNLAELREILFKNINKEYNRLINNDLEEIRKEYNNALYWKNEKHIFQSVSQWEGIIREADEAGRLVIEKNGNEKHFVINEIKFIR
ncbi:biotin--[acetyl-CoA-carboxylase] ligase [Hyphobacterium sp. CCMP332]|nr:biotin--[acetyl-CoA-carboxylase] ligase [Hyphobacterium sp. CCMP332]